MDKNTSTDKSSKKGFFTKIWAWDKSKKFYKNARFWTIVIAALILGGAFGSGSQTKTNTITSNISSNASTSTQSSADAAKAAAEQKDKQEAELQQNIVNAVAVDYADLLRNSNNYKGKYMKFTGQVIQTDAGNSYCRVATKATYNVYAGDILFVSPCKGSEKIITNDVLNIVATGDGTYTYESISKTQVELPKVQAVKIELAK